MTCGFQLFRAQIYSDAECRRLGVHGGGAGGVVTQIARRPAALGCSSGYRAAYGQVRKSVTYESTPRCRRSPGAVGYLPNAVR
jgi:hypothetical protein